MKVGNWHAYIVDLEMHCPLTVGFANCDAEYLEQVQLRHAIAKDTARANDVAATDSDEPTRFRLYQTRHC
jgi:hypothetical protein